MLTLNGIVHIAPFADDLYDDLATALFTAAVEAVGRRGWFHLALSGGSTPEPFYIRLVTDPRYRDLPWRQTHLWIVDERRVPEDDPRCNYRMIRETLIDHVPLRSRQCHPMPVLANDAAERYEAELRRHVGAETDVPRLDFVLLGMGDDAHTASLFPHSPALQERERLIAINKGPHVTPPDRVTMTYPLLNAARQLVALVTGAKKTATIQRVAAQLREHGPDPVALPITGIEPVRMAWFLDAQAAGQDDDLMPDV